jgi:hypothetical protein
VSFKVPPGDAVTEAKREEAKAALRELGWGWWKIWVRLGNSALLREKIWVRLGNSALLRESWCACLGALPRESASQRQECASP